MHSGRNDKRCLINIILIHVIAQNIIIQFILRIVPSFKSAEVDKKLPK